MVFAVVEIGATTGAMIVTIDAMIAGTDVSGEVNVELVFAADALTAHDGRRRDAAHQWRAGRERADGAHRAGSLLGYAGMDIGRDNGLVVDRSYADKAPFAFTGEIKHVVFDIAPHTSEDDARALHEHAAQVLAAHAASA